MKTALISAALLFASCGHVNKCVSDGGMLLRAPARMSCEAFQRAETQALNSFNACPRLWHDFDGLIVAQHDTDAWTDTWDRRVSGLAFCRTAKTPTYIEVGPVEVIPHEMVHIALGCPNNHDWEGDAGACCDGCTRTIHDSVEEAQMGLGQ